MVIICFLGARTAMVIGGPIVAWGCHTDADVLASPAAVLGILLPCCTCSVRPRPPCRRRKETKPAGMLPENKGAAPPLLVPLTPAGLQNVSRRTAADTYRGVSRRRSAGGGGEVRGRMGGARDTAEWALGVWVKRNRTHHMHECIT